VRLDVDAPGLEAYESMGDRACQHAADASAGGFTRGSRLRAKTELID
jgi:hypothetical protein